MSIYLGISFSFGSKFVQCRYILEFHFHLVLNLCNVDIYILEFHFHLVLNLCNVDISWNFIFIWTSLYLNPHNVGVSIIQWTSKFCPHIERCSQFTIIVLKDVSSYALLKRPVL